jgi:hypothetical protein
MNSTNNLWPSPKFRFLATQLRYQLVSSKQMVIYFIHTFEFVNLFPIKTYQNYSREEINADQRNVQLHLCSYLQTKFHMNSSNDS